MRSVPRHVAQAEVKRVLEGLVSALLHGPNSARIETTLHKNIYYFHILVKPGDMGRVLGKKGLTASSLRQIMEAISNNYGVTFLVQILEMQGEGAGQEKLLEEYRQRKMA